MTDVRSPVVDRSVIEDLRRSTGDDDEFLAELIETYLADGAGQLAELDSAFDAGDAPAIIRPAHTLKSSSASLGAVRLAQICREIEAAARVGELDGLGPAVASARTAWAATVDALRPLSEPIAD